MKGIKQKGVEEKVLKELDKWSEKQNKFLPSFPDKRMMKAINLTEKLIRKDMIEKVEGIIESKAKLFCSHISDTDDTCDACNMIGEIKEEIKKLKEGFK